MSNVVEIQGPLDDYEEVLGRFIAVVRRTPIGAVLAWTTDQVESAPGVYAADWLDVYVPALCGPAHLAWAWTVESPDGVSPADGALFEDGILRPRWSKGSDLKSFTLAWPADTTALVDDDAVLAWSSAGLERAMWSWCAEVAGRPDLSFRFNDALQTPFERLLRPLS